VENDSQSPLDQRPDWRLFLPAAGVIVAIFVLSHQERPPTIGNDPELSAIAGHLGAYGLLGGAFFLAFAAMMRSTRRAALLAIICAAIYGIADEFHQYFVPGRHTDPWDLVADVVGATIVVGLLYMLKRD
jgi:VanZ family protein